MSPVTPDHNVHQEAVIERMRVGCLQAWRMRPDMPVTGHPTCGMDAVRGTMATPRARNAIFMRFMVTSS